MANASAKVVCAFAIRNKVLVRNDNQRVNVALKLFDAAVGNAHPARTFELERLGNNTNGQDALLARCTGNHRSCTGAGTTAHTGRDEHHVRSRQMIVDLIDHFFGRCPANFWLGTGSETFRNGHAHLDETIGLVHCQCLGIRVGHDKVAPLEACCDHVIDGVSARAADTEDRDTRLQFLNVGHLQVYGHVILATRWRPRYGRTLFFPNFLCHSWQLQL
jgi:hypothetical protein